MQLPLLRVCGSFLFRQSKKTRGILWFVWVFFAFLKVRRRNKFNFLYVDIWFGVTECKFIVKNSSFELLVVFSPIFVADTKKSSVYNVVAPLKNTTYVFFCTSNHKFSNKYWASADFLFLIKDIIWNGFY